MNKNRKPLSQTLYDKLWQRHLVKDLDSGSSLIYIDRHILHEVTSPQAFENLSLSNRKPWKVANNLATPEHNVPTTTGERKIEKIENEVSRLQVKTLDDNVKKFKIKQIPINDSRQGIVHVMGPEQGFTLPGTTVVCGDSHTATHGAFGAMAFGIGTSEVEHVLATQCIVQKKLKNMLIKIEGKLRSGVYAKDIILKIIGTIGTAGGTGYAIEFAGSTIRDLSIESRMTICNMAIEAGARVGIIAVDVKTIAYFKDRPFAPAGKMWQKAIADWQELYSDKDANFDKVVRIKANEITPQVTWGTSPEMVVSINDKVPSLKKAKDDITKNAYKSAYKYMGLTPNKNIQDIKLDYIFIGSCTNSRLEDLQEVAKIVKGKKIANTIERAMIVPGSGLIKQAAEQEGLDKIFIASGFEWRNAGCSMCLGMNDDQLPEGKHCASSSNRNFEGRQGKNGRTHLVSPAMAAAAAIHGHFIDISK